MESPLPESTVGWLPLARPFRHGLALIVTLFGLLSLIVGCRVEGEFWVERSGAGRGYFTLYQIPLGKPDLELELAKEGFIVEKVKEIGPDTLKAWVRWENFTDPRPFESLEELPDGSVRLSFGRAPDFGSLTVHVKGKVIESTGYLKDGDTVIFEGGKQAILTFRPSSRILPILIGLLLGLGVLILFVKSWIRRGRPA